MGRRVGWAIVIVMLISIGGYFLADFYRSTPETVEPKYVGRDSCIQCHQTQASLFQGSDHDLAMDLATDQTVLADFNDQSLEHHGIVSRMFRDGARFMVNTEGPDGELHDYEIKFVFGVRPLQQYMVELDRPADAEPDEIGRVQVLRISWDTNRQKWFYLNPPDVPEKLEPNDPLHWTGITQNWNTSCAYCHSTDLQKNFDPLANDYHTTFSEIDVSCEACHGPGSYHVELANRKSLFWDRQRGYGLAKLKTESNLPQIESCAPCHSRRTVIQDGFQPGCNFDDYFATQLIVEPVYHADGQIRDEDYVYGSFRQSKMFHNGIRCSDCHDPHSTKLKFDDNQLCTSCHQHPAGKYDTPNHHHHQPGTPGASCVECHMPATTYMMVDPRRDHSFRVPRPDLSVRLGTPNSCTACHIDSTKLAPRESQDPPVPLNQYLDWMIAAEQGDQIVASELARIDAAMLQATETWYPAGQSPEKTGYYQQLAEGLTQHRPATLMELAKDVKAPAIFRASAMNALVEDASSASLESAMKSLSDPSADVVTTGLMRLDMEIARIGDRQRYASSGNSVVELKPIAKAIAKLFRHPSRRVRMEAARVFVTFDQQSRMTFAEPEQRREFDKALGELKQSLKVENDRASTHMMLGSLHELSGEYDRAQDDYRTAMRVDPNLAGPRANLAALIGADADQLRRQIQQSQSSGGVNAGQLKSLLVRIQQLGAQAATLRSEEHELLARDLERSQNLTDTHGLHYRFAMSSYLQQDLAATEKHLLEAHRQQPVNPTYLMGLATYYIQVNQPGEALKYITPLVQSDSRHPGYQALLKQVQEMQK